MRVVADLHIHSRFARGCSDAITVETLEKWACIKGLDVLGTGDCLHPEWRDELEASLVPDEHGVLRTSGGFPFILTVEVSQIFKQDGATRRVHSLLLIPSFTVLDEVTAYFKEHGRVDYDGRPTFGMGCETLLSSLHSIDERIELIPAHVWTPWYALFGSKSGFDSVEAAFGSMTEHVHALETGLSSDPAMNRRVSDNDELCMVSFSDAHSCWPWRLGREATVFDIETLTYDAIVDAIRTGEGLASTIEVDPAYGKYHLDGHRECDVCMTPDEAVERDNICPSCGEALTLGVLHRVQELADRDATNVPSFRTLLPLHELLATVFDVGKDTKTVWTRYWRLIAAFGDEFTVLLDASRDALSEHVPSLVVNAILANREGAVETIPGYDGVYGQALLPTMSSEKNASLDAF
jgi:uncharacterized protein (TIGR00375 family)